MASRTEELLEGFQINWITIWDLNTAEIVWHGNEDYSCSGKIIEIKLPKNILKRKSILREINFSSIESWEKLRLVHTVFYKGVVMDEWCSDFGFVNKNSCNSWQSVIEAAPEVNMITARVLSGNVEILTKFYNREELVTTSRLKLYYV